MSGWQQDDYYTDGDLARLLFVLGVREENGQLSASVESTAPDGAMVHGNLTSLALSLARTRGIDTVAIRERAAAYVEGEAT